MDEKDADRLDSTAGPAQPGRPVGHTSRAIPLEPAEPPAGRSSPAGADRRPGWHTLLVVLALLGILALALAFRLPEIRSLDPDRPLSPADYAALRFKLWEGGPVWAVYPWDEGLSLHPDERFLTMVATSIAFPDPCRALIPHLGGSEDELPPGDLGACISAYLDSSSSSLNPRNRGHTPWVYGSLPMTIFRGVIESLNVRGFSQVTIFGRLLSVLADLATILLTFFLGRRLYGTRVGLLAALFLSLSVLNIQNAHFFTVDIATSLVTLLCVYLAVVLAEGRGNWGTFVLLGLLFGTAVACKINMAAFALVIGLAAAVRVWRRVNKRGEQDLWPALREIGLQLLVAALLSLVVFRLAQPDSFTGPGLFDVRLEQRFKENLAWVQGAVSGEIDYPPSHQWTDRAPLWFPWKNMVLWGLGLTLGLAAWAGVVLAGWQLVRRRDLRCVVPLSWTLLLFIYQGVQFVKTMRYFLPIYPLLCLFAAYLLWWLWDRARAREPSPRWRTVTATALIGLVVLGTLLWAWGFVQIYNRPITRATASRWIYQNIPTDQGARLRLDDGSEVPISIPNAQTYDAGGPTTTTAFSLPAGGTATALTVTHLEDLDGDPGEEQLEVLITADPEGGRVLARGIVAGNFSGPAGDGAPGTATFTPVPLEADLTYYLRLRGLKGTVKTWAVALANEEWDDPVPMRVDGKDGFSIYRGLMLQPYAEDTPQKVDDMLHQLANADYVCLSSNRLYDSIPRLPMRYPATTRYYRALFDGSLGFERVATFTSYPTLLALGSGSDIAAMSDEERAAAPTGWPGIPIPDDDAEEVFSVYDHPKVILFRRTDAFDLEQARALLTEGIDWETIARIRPVEVPGYRDLMLTEEEREVQQQGGSWSDIFDPNGWTNVMPLPVWLILVELLGLAALPLAHLLVGRLADGGYLPAKALGILLLGYLSWLLAATKVLPYTRTTIGLVFGLLLLLGAIVGWLRREELARLFRTRRRLLLLEEAIFLGAFFLFLFIRMGNPDVWHPWFGGEKPMDLAYINAVVRSTTFPPYDPWFSGGYMNYHYYFGCVLVATLIKFTGILSGVAFNLAIPLFYGLTCTGVFTVVYHLVRRRKAGQEDDGGWDRRAITFGLVGVAFVAVLGNLGEYMLLLLQLGKASEATFESSIPGLASLVKAIEGAWQAAHGGLSIGIGNWYWDASRVIPRGEINEFPWFTFLYADLHAHMIALPYTLLGLTQVVALIRDHEKAERGLRSLIPPPWVLLGMILILGTLRTAHAWDYYTYFLLVTLGWAIALYERRRRLDWPMAASVGLTAALLWVCSSLFFRPFWARYGAYYTSFTPWTGERTQVGEFLIINGFFVFILTSYLIAEAFGQGARDKPLHLVGLVWRYWDRLPTLVRRLRRFEVRHGNRTLGKSGIPALTVLLPALVILLLLELYLHLPVEPPRDPLQQPLPLLRLRGQPLIGWLVLLAILGIVLLFRRREQGVGRFAVLLILAGLGLSGLVELWTVKGDIGRMNTFFRFYFQTWILWGIASAAVLPRLWQRMQGWSKLARRAWRAFFFILVGLCALYPLLSTPAKMHDRFPNTGQGPGLDGEAFMETDIYPDEHGPIVLAEDAAAIAWLRENVVGTPVILEAASGLWNVPLYRWGSRISIYTGLPTVIGWDHHQRQQRAALELPVVDQRLRDVSSLYNDPDISNALELLAKYHISYIVVGQLERYYYAPEGLAKFERMVGPYLERVYPAAPLEPAEAALPPPTPTAGPYPSPATSSTSYPAPTTGPASPETTLPPTTSQEGTVIYRVLPSVWSTVER